MKRIWIYAPLAALMATLALAQTQPPQQITVNVNQQLEPFRTYYSSQTEWPRSHGYKPFKRYEWDMLQRGWPDGDVPAGAYWRALEQRETMPRMHSSLDEPWVNLGPYNHGGRTRVIRFHPNNPEIMIAGAVSGGLWQSTDAGESWMPFTDQLSNMAVGCFEFDPTHPDTMYLGTGEGYYNGDAVQGIGLLKSTNGGQSWNTTGLNWQYNAGQSVFRISIDPRNTQIVMATTNSGVFRSTNGGQSFTNVMNGNANELKRDPQHPDTLLCGLGMPWGDNNNGIYRSTDNGQTWEPSSTGLPDQNDIGRIVISFFQGNTLIVYAGVCGTFDYNGSQMIGIFRSIDNGLTWAQMSPGGANHYASQGWYDMGLAVKPDESSMLLSSGLDLHRSTNSGALWSRLTYWYNDFGNPNYVHADHHEIVFHPTNFNEVWEVTDGGIFKSTNVGTTWEEKSNGYVTFQYYAMGNATIDTALAYGGTQDNGTFCYRGEPDFESVFGGDGGYCVVDYTRDSTIYVEYQNGNRYRSDNAGRNFSEINNGIDGDGAWVTPMVLDPFDHMTIYTTTTNGSVWKSLNQGRTNTWFTVGQQLSGNMQVLEVSPTVPGRLYLGTNNSVYRYEQESNLWTNVTGNLPNEWVTRVVPDPYASNIVYVTQSGFGNGHIWKSIQSGGAWQNISGNLPDVPYQDIVVDRRDPSTLYVGGDVGVYRTTNGGQSWHIYGEGLPAVRVDDMDLQTATGILRIATHGRGMWDIPTGGVALAIFFPNGGEVLPLDDQLAFRWSGSSLGGTVTMEINRNYPSQTWDTLFTGSPNDGAEDWIISGPESDHVRFRITLDTEPTESDSTNSDCRIVQPGVEILRPNGGETVFTGARDTIEFRRTIVPENLLLQINRDYPGGAWETINESVFSDSAQPWIVQMPAGEHVRVRLSSPERLYISDESNADFTIRAPQMAISAPTAGEELQAGGPYTVRWNATEHQGNVRILVNRSYPDGSWEIIATNTINDGQHTWTVSGPASQTCRIKVTTLLDPQTFVVMDGDFSIAVTAAEEPVELPKEYTLSEPQPNPFNPTTQILMELPARTRVDARAYNRLGQEAAVLASEYMEPGKHRLTFDGTNLPSGLYFIRIEAYGHPQMMKAVLIK